MRSLKKSKVYRGKIADMRPRATRARLRRSTVCPVKRLGGGGRKEKKQGKTKKCVDARQLSHAPHNAARQNPTHYSFTHNMMPLMCHPLQQCTDADIDATEPFGQRTRRAPATNAPTPQLHVHCAQQSATWATPESAPHQPRSHAYATWAKLLRAPRVPLPRAPDAGLDAQT